MEEGIVHEEPKLANEEGDQNGKDKGLKGKRNSWRELVNFDTFDIQTSRVNPVHTHASQKAPDWITILKLAFQSIGVVYGDIGTSPMYVLPGVFPNGISHRDDILGVLSLIIYSLIIILMIKYVFIVLSANDNGDGGTFALYSLICRYAKVSFTPSQQAEDKDVSNYRLEVPNRRLQRASFVKLKLENSIVAKHALLFMTMLGTSMVLGDGILTPCISVLSAVGGIKEAAKSLTDDTIMWISVVILIFLFQIQRFGTDKVGYTFAPVLTIWFFFIGIIGMYNFIKYDPGVIKAVNPVYIVSYFKRNKKNAWISLGGVVLCLTGSEALFADLGHFNVRSIQISTCGIVFPSIVLAYIGQASYLRRHSEDVTNAFYRSVPKPVYWPMFVVAVLAAIIASQALISASFSIVQQSLAMGCFPRVKVVHTSDKYEGQVYVPEINTILMIACVSVTLGFKNTVQIGNAYGIAVIFVYTLTSTFLLLVMVMIWKTNIFLIILYVLTIGLLELLYLSSVLYKFPDGGYLPLAMSAVLVMVMYTWSYGYRKKYMYELENKVSLAKLQEIASNPSIYRVPGLAIFYTDLVQGITPVFTHYVENVPALHSILVFVSIKSLPISKVPQEERFVFSRIEPHTLHIFRCVVRYGYTDARREQESFEEMLVDNLKVFIQNDLIMLGRAAEGSRSSTRSNIVSESIDGDDLQAEMAMVDNAFKNGGVFYLIGESEVTAIKGSSLGKRMVINYCFSWLKRCVRQPDEVFLIPRKRLLKVGMIYEV